MRLLAAVIAGCAAWLMLARPRASSRVRLSPRPSPSRSPLVRASIAIAGVALAAMAQPMIVPFVGAAVAAIFGWRRRQAAKLALSCRRAVPEMLYALSSELRAGRPIAAAVQSAAVSGGPLEPSLAGLAASIGRGADFADELEALAKRRGHERLSSIAAAWRATSPLGASVSGLLERLAEAYEHDDTADDELTAALAGPRSTVVMLMCLPFFGVALGQSIGARPAQLLWHRPLGWALDGGALILDFAGLMWWRRIVANALIGQ